MRPSHAEESFRFVSDPELDRRIDAYMPVVMETKPHLDATGRVREAEADRLANRWIEETEAGKLKSLRPLMVGDSVLEGTTGQILKIQRGLSNTLMLRGERRVREGEARQGAEDVIAAARVLRSTQYSDLETATLVGLQVRRSLMVLGKAASRMDADDRKWLSQAILPLRTDQEQLADMAQTMRRLYDEKSWRQTGVSLPETPGLAALASLRRPQPGHEVETMRSVTEAVKSSPIPEELRPFTASLKRVLASEIHTNVKVDEIRALD